MNKKRTTYDTAVEIYNNRYGKEPTQKEIENLWHKYANEWKNYDGFIDWLEYHGL
jgi:hypothetical protein